MAGNDAAATEMFDRYVGRLLNLARQRLSSKLARRVDADDIVQSAYRSFFAHARNGDYVLRRSGDLWRLLTAITLHKLYGQVEINTSQRRDFRRDDEQQDVVTAGVEPLPDEVAEVSEQVQQAMDRLNPLERRVFESRLSGQTIEEIAKDVDRSQRTVRRLLSQVQSMLEKSLKQG